LKGDARENKGEERKLEADQQVLPPRIDHVDLSTPQLVGYLILMKDKNINNIIEY
jgi:hypothetical protein